MKYISLAEVDLSQTLLVTSIGISHQVISVCTGMVIVLLAIIFVISLEAEADIVSTIRLLLGAEVSTRLVLTTIADTENIVTSVAFQTIGCKNKQVHKSVCQI